MAAWQIKISLIMRSVAVFSLLICFGPAEAKELPLKPFVYTEDFEGDKDPVQFWKGDNDKYNINFKGLTEENSFSGRKSFKLDVTFKAGGRYYWYIPVKIPSEGSLNFTGHICLGKESTGSAAANLELDLAYLPSPLSATCPASSSAAKGEWKLAQGDPVKFGRDDRNRSMNQWVWGASGENVGVCVDRILICLSGKKGERAVVYVDDIKLEGNIPSDKDYLEEADGRWSPYKEKYNEKISSWEKIMEESEKELASLSNLSAEAERMKGEAEEKLAALKGKVAENKKRGFIHLREKETEIDPYLEQFQTVISNITVIQAGSTGFKDIFCYVVKPISPVKILPDSFILGKISDTISITACPGEYEPASFVICPLTNLGSLRLEATALKKGWRKSIPISNIDIKTVKCWYQSGKAWFDIVQDRSRRVLTPELLLKDDSLVRTDAGKKDNYIKLSFPGGDKYICISKEEDSGAADEKFHSIEEFPVRDSSRLLPVDIPAHTKKQFWVTVKVPDNAKPGTYTGKIKLSTAEKSLGSITLSLKVLPFKLAKPKTYYSLKEDFVCSIYYRGVLSTGKGYVSPKIKTEEQFRTEMKDLVAHGVDNPIVSQPFDEKLLGTVLKIRNEAGMDNRSLYYWGVMTGYPLGTIKKALAFAKSNGVQEVFFYGLDEARDERLKSQRNAWQAIHEAGGKTFVSGFPGTFEAMGDLLDVLLWAGQPDLKEAGKWHGIGHKIWNYANPQGGVENPEIYRRNFGLLLWKAKYDGACTFAYQHCGGDLGSVWNDFDTTWFRDHNFTYPTMDGVIDTIAWEGYREAMDDIRYATTLRQWIEKSKNSKDVKTREVGCAAEDYLDKLDVNDKDLDLIRLKIISYILKLTEQVDGGGVNNWYLHFWNCLKDVRHEIGTMSKIYGDVAFIFVAIMFCPFVVKRA